MASSSSSSSSSHPRNEEHDGFSGIEPHGIRRKVEESSRLFDVFINHRGPDVKLTVALQLYNSLTQLGIHTFLDSEEKEVGDSFPSTIESAIHSASAHIAVFSTGYADSPWCLAELLLMFHSKAKIFPVFYGVKPFDLRHIEKGKYAKAFTEYEEKRRYMEKLTEWKETLQSVSFITGYEINGNFNISDCQNIVLAIQKEVQSKKSLHVAKYPVGLHRLVKDFERQCLDKLVKDFERQCQTNKGGKKKAQVVGIFGMGGVGKTTLAKELFNRKRSQYTQACFLFDVREAYANNSFPSLQMKFLKDIFQKDGFNFQSTEEGKTQIADCINRSNQGSFLLVVDDIDHVQQLDALLLMDIQKKLVDSLVIVTTRDVGVLINTGISAAYNVKGMDRDHAGELFCWHAFGQPHPANDYENLVNSFLDVCGGLPLSLQVLGSHVHGRDQNYWSLEFNKVSKTLPRDIQQRLKISFDALDYEEQQIFMDIACFFIDKSKSVAMEVWQASGWSAQHALETLKNKCLVQEIDDIFWWKGPSRVGDERLALRMHDHLRDLGREMARNSRLWRRQDLEYLESKGFQNILAQTKGRCFHSLFDESTRCRIAYLVGESDVGADTPTRFLWLELWYTLPTWIPLQNLRYLIIRNPRLKTLWQSHVQMPNKLKELHIYDSYLQELSVAHLSCLERIVLHSCYRLKTVSGISDLRKLVELDISKCPAIEQMRLVGLSSLKHFKADDSLKLTFFELDGCINLQTISGILNPEKLVKINIRDCPKLEVLPSLEGPNALQIVTIDGCGKLNLLLSKSPNMKRVTGKFDLQRLCISDCPNLEELPCFAHQTCLEKISIFRCGMLQNITLPPKIVEVVIDGCIELKTVAAICDHSECLELKELSSVDRLSRLKWITIQSCYNLQTIQSIAELRALESLQLSNCPELEELPCSARQTCLEKISIARCGKLQNITLPPKLVELIIEGCTELKTVTTICDHSECLELKELPNVAQLSRLKWITIQSCIKLQTVQGIDKLRALESLQLSNCPELEGLPCFASQTCLEKISIIRCRKLQSITLPSKLVKLVIEGCRKLKTVTASCDHSECLELQELSSVDRLSRLECITIQGIDELRAWESLELCDCPELEELPCFARQTCLEKISIVRCEKLNNITLPPKLVKLVIKGCRELKTVTAISDHSECLELQELPSVAQLSRLKCITIQICNKLQTIQGIDELRALESLELCGCPELEELPCFARQTCLEKISIVRCGKLHNITLPPKLVKLVINGCRELKTVTAISDHSECLELQELPSVDRLSRLKWITIQSCYNLQTIQSIDELRALESLQLSNCPELEELPCSARQICLEKISIVRCEKLQSITLPPKLVELIIEGCTELKTVTAICDHSECLERITIRSCIKLQTIKGIDESPALESFQLSNCPQLENSNRRGQRKSEC